MQTVQEIVGGETYEYAPLGQYIVRANGVCGGRPTFKYTRIEVAGVLEQLAAGRNIKEIVVGYRGRVPEEAILEAMLILTRHYLETMPELKQELKAAHDYDCA